MSPSTWTKNGLRKISILMLILGMLCTGWMVLSTGESRKNPAETSGLPPDISFPHQFAHAAPSRIPVLNDHLSQADSTAFDQVTTGYLQYEDVDPQIRLASTNHQPTNDRQRPATMVPEVMVPEVNGGPLQNIQSPLETDETVDAGPDDASTLANPSLQVLDLPLAIDEDIADASSVITQAESSPQTSRDSIPALQIKNIQAANIFGPMLSGSNPPSDNVQDLPQLPSNSEETQSFVANSAGSRNSNGGLPAPELPFKAANVATATVAPVAAEPTGANGLDQANQDSPLAIASAKLTNQDQNTAPLKREPYEVDESPAVPAGNGSIVQQAPVPAASVESPELIDWWNYRIADPNRTNSQVRTVSLADLIAAAIEHSPRIRTLQRVPQITGTQVEIARSDFDPILSLDNTYTDTMDPVGNTLTTGGAPFLQDNIWDSIGRVSKKLEGGSEVSFYQKLGFKNSNSNFFAPQDQGTATLGMDLRVPLLKGGGNEFNRAPIMIAELETDVAWDQYQVELQKEIADIGTLYWNLQTTRALYLQQQRSVQRAQRVLSKLEARVDYDASISQIAQAKAELSLRINELQSSLQAMVELEITVRERIGDPDLEFVPNVEMIPSQFAADVFDQQEPLLNELLATALANRLELHAEDSKIQIADRHVFRSRCGLAPKLDMVFNVYSSSLKGDSGVERAYQEQFSNAPGFSGALEYEIPYGRRSAKATVQQAELQRQQAADLKQIQRNEIIADVQKAYTRWISAKASYMTAKQTVVDMRRSVEQLQLRWEEFAFIEGPVSQGATPSLALDQLLAGQRRLADTEARLANAELSVALAQQGLLTATGSLFSAEFEANANLGVPTFNQ